jgi:hypothetical protein
VRLFLIYLLTGFLLAKVSLAQESASFTTDTMSLQFARGEEKIAFLERYLNLPTKVEAAEYHIVFYDNSKGRVPGPSDWDIRVVVKVAPKDIPLWLESLTETAEPFDLAWVYELAKAGGWQLTSAPKFFVGNKRVAVFETEGVVVWWLSTF